MTSGKQGPNSLPHVFLTQDADWDPKVLDLKQSENPEWYSNADNPPLLNPDFDIHGDYRHCIAYKVDRYDDSTTITNFNPNDMILVHDQDVYFDSSAELLPDFDIETATDHCVLHANLHRYVHNTVTDNYPHIATRQEHHGARQVKDDPRDYEALHPRFAWLNSDIIRKTFVVTTQFAQLPLFTLYCANILKLRTMLRMSHSVMNPWLLTPSSQTPLLLMVVKNMPNSLSESVPYCQTYMG
jgi:hypothetical protein